MRKLGLMIITIIILTMVSSCSSFICDEHGDGINSCELSFATDNGNINCQELIDKYFTEDEIQILDERVSSIKTVKWPEENIFGRTYWNYNPAADVVGNYPYTCEIVLNETKFDEIYASDISDAKLYMIQITLLHELCHVLWSDPYAKPADESVPSAVSRKNHNDEWYYGFKGKVVEFTTTNHMQKFRIKAALEKYGYEKFGSEYNYIKGCRSLDESNDDDCCELCGGVIYN